MAQLFGGRMSNRGFGAILVAGVVCAWSAWGADLAPAPIPPAAASIAPPSTWQYQTTLYGWATGINGNIGVGRLPSSAVNASFGDVLKNLHGAAMGSFVARNDTFIFGLDLVWARIGTDTSFRLPGSGPFANVRAGTSASLRQDMTIGTAFAGYRIPIGSPDMNLYGTVGARYQDLSAKIGLSTQFNGVLQPFGFSLTTQQTMGWVDPLVGFAMIYHLNDKWFVNALGDIGGFGVGSRLTTQGLVAVGYNWTRSISTTAGYRALYTDFVQGNGNGGSFRYQTTLYGPFVGASYNF
jgi:hypothetical protein